MNEAHIRLTNDSPSFTLVHPRIRAIGPRDLHLAKGRGLMATLRSLAMNALRLNDFWSITEGMAALAHDIPGLLALLGWREPARAPSSA